jgi:hypothetical protein
MDALGAAAGAVEALPTAGATAEPKLQITQDRRDAQGRTQLEERDQ